MMYRRFLRSLLLCVSSFMSAAIAHQGADLIIFSKDRAMQLYALLESIEEAPVKGIASITIIYYPTHQKHEEAYQIVQKSFPCAIFVRQGNNPHADFLYLTLKTIFESPTPYVIFAVDDNIVTDAVDLQEMARLLEQEHAYGFYLRLGPNINFCYANNMGQTVPKFQKVTENVLKWAPIQGSSWDFGTPNTLDMTLYRKKDLFDTFNRLGWLDGSNPQAPSAPNTFEGRWSTPHLTNSIGLCYNTSRAKNIPANLVQTSCYNRNGNIYSASDLLNRFLAGNKIDIRPFHKYLGNSAHEELRYSFVPRE